MGGLVASGEGIAAWKLCALNAPAGAKTGIELGVDDDALFVGTEDGIAGIGGGAPAGCG
jgi:hypothetical protein